MHPGTLPEPTAIRETFHIKLAVPGTCKVHGSPESPSRGDNTHSSGSDTEPLRAGGLTVAAEGMAAQRPFYCVPDPLHKKDSCLGALRASVLILLQIQQHQCFAEGKLRPKTQ